MRQHLAPEKALAKLASLCSRGEQAEADLRLKLKAWEIEPHECERIIQYLKDNGFLNEQRYACAFVHDKFRFNAWGRVKIAYALRQKHVSSEVIERALRDIDATEYYDGLLRLLRGKMQTMIGRNPMAARTALLRFAASRGFEHELCYKAVDDVLVVDFGAINGEDL